MSFLPTVLHNITLNSTYQGKVCSNKFSYVSSSTPTSTNQDPDNVIADFLAVVFPSIRAVVSDGCVFTSIDVLRELPTLAVSSFTLISNNTGTRTGTEGLAPFIAWGFRSGRVEPFFRRSFKRFAGVVEGDVAGKNPAAGIVSSLNALAAAMASAWEPVNVGSLTTLNPATISRFVNGQPRSSLAANVITTYESRGLTTQNTRK